jgi:hypothetical protein
MAPGRHRSRVDKGTGNMNDFLRVCGGAIELEYMWSQYHQRMRLEKEPAIRPTAHLASHLLCSSSFFCAVCSASQSSRSCCSKSIEYSISLLYIVGFCRPRNFWVARSKAIEQFRLQLTHLQAVRILKVGPVSEAFLDDLVSRPRAWL